jgi:hypothetical protein
MHFEIGTIVVENPVGYFQSHPVNQSYENYPINVGIVKTFHPSFAELCNADGLKVYTIVFYFIDGERDLWHFENEEQRDEEYNRLIDLVCKDDHGKI